MVLFLFSDPKYSTLTEGLIKSLRHHGNNYKIYYYMMNFSDVEFNEFYEKFKEDTEIVYKRKTVDMYSVNLHGGVANPLYQNNRVSYLIELMEEQKEDILLFGSNSLVFSSIDYFEDILKNNYFSFLERKKTTRKGTIVKTIKEFSHYIDSNKLNIDEELYHCRPVLLGTHGFKNDKLTLDVLKRWKYNIETTKGWEVSQYGSDMMMFVKSIIQVSKDKGEWIKYYTEDGINRDKTRLCCTNQIVGNPVWFAKGALQRESKNPRYHKHLKKFLHVK
tara:strand:- start:12784 stop:13611 length:828 start_codon:yes stop_codon:yes gene_type:complete